jgi:hypothetical protein
MDLLIFYSRREGRQEEMCAALNHEYSCPGSPDIADYLGGAAETGKNKSV